MATIAAGQTAPDFTLNDQNGEPVCLRKILGKQPVVLFFYVKDETPVCRREVCAFRDHYAEFHEAGFEVIGISPDAPEVHAESARKHALPYRLLSDPGGKVAASYGIAKLFGIIPGRVTFVLDREGTVRHVYSGLLGSDLHVEEALRGCARLIP